MRAMNAMGQRTWARGQPLELLELPQPEPREDEVRVRVAVAGVNPVDWKMREGGEIRLAAKLLGPPLPFVPGIDFAGTIDAVGARVSGFSLGDRVVGATDFSRGQRGSYAQAVLARADQLCKLPDAVSFESAGATPVAGSTAWLSLVEIGKLPQGDASAAVLVLGAAGGVGQFAVQVAKLRGARAIAVCSSRNQELARSLGADVALDYGAGEVLEEARKHGPYQVVIDCVGGYSAAACRSLLRAGGRHVMVSAGKQSVQVLVPPFTSRLVLGRSSPARLRALVDGIAAGQIRVVIAARFPLAEAEQATRLSRAGRTAGKIILTP
jgi:NADPH:quinone reductase-like Zn-dependent oxidoreductase